MTTLHITSGDIAGNLIRESGVAGELLVWRDILYDGPRRKPGWPDESVLAARAEFLHEQTGGGLSKTLILDTLLNQYAKLKTAAEYEVTVLWFDACLFDQAMLCHILSRLKDLGARKTELLCVDAFPGIEPFHGLGQLSAEQMASVYPSRRALTDPQFEFAEAVDTAFAAQDASAFQTLAAMRDAPLRWVPAALVRWLEELPDTESGLGKLQRLALEAIRSGRESPAEIYSYTASKDTPPQFWGDTTLWAKINALAEQQPSLVNIQGPQARLPQWEGIADLNLFRILPG